jgi:hypothetical protein
VQVVGACIYVALLNRLLLPWYTSDYALEQMADALEQAAALFEKIYTSQHNRMRVAALAAGGSVAADADAASRGEANGCVSTTAAGDGGGTTGGGGGHAGVLDSAAAAAELAALEAGEAALHVALRQEVLRRLVAVQMSLAKDTVSWRRGVLATPQVRGSMDAALHIGFSSLTNSRWHVGSTNLVVRKLRQHSCEVEELWRTMACPDCCVVGSVLRTSSQHKQLTLSLHTTENAPPSCCLQIVLDVLGAMIELVEALACQRLALAPFTRQAASTAAGAGASAAGESAAPSGLLRVSGHCYSVWAQPLHPVWLQVGPGGTSRRHWKQNLICSYVLCGLVWQCAAYG